MDKSSEHSEGMGDDASGDESDSSDESTEHDDILISKLRAAAETGRNALLDVARNTVAQKDDAHSIFNCAANTICSDLLGAGVITAIQAQIKEKMGSSSLSLSDKGCGLNIWTMSPRVTASYTTRWRKTLALFTAFAGASATSSRPRSASLIPLKNYNLQNF